MDLIHSETFTDIGATSPVTTAAFGTTRYKEILICIDYVEGVDGRTITPEIQWNARQGGNGTWSSGAGDVHILEFDATPALFGINLTATAIAVTGMQTYRLPVLGTHCRVNFVITGASGDFDFVRLDVYGVLG